MKIRKTLIYQLINVQQAVDEEARKLRDTDKDIMLKGEMTYSEALNMIAGSIEYLLESDELK